MALGWNWRKKIQQRFFAQKMALLQTKASLFPLFMTNKFIDPLLLNWVERWFYEQKVGDLNTRFQQVTSFEIKLNSYVNDGSLKFLFPFD